MSIIRRKRVRARDDESLPVGRVAALLSLATLVLLGIALGGVAWFAHRGSQIQWGDVATWVTGVAAVLALVGAASAVVIALAALRLEHERDKTEVRLRERDAAIELTRTVLTVEATLRSAQSSQGGPDARRKTRGNAYAALQEFSDLWRVRLSDYVNVTLTDAQLMLQDYMGLAHDRDVRMRLEVERRHSLGENDARVRPENDPWQVQALGVALTYLSAARHQINVDSDGRFDDFRHRLPEPEWPDVQTPIAVEYPPKDDIYDDA